MVLQAFSEMIPPGMAGEYNEIYYWLEGMIGLNFPLK